MSSLLELQVAMAAGILQDAVAPLAPLIRADGLAYERRLRVYRNNTFISLTAALKSTYPVVCQLVDERFFDYAVSEFIGVQPPTAPRLAEYGGGFADFLGGFPPVRHLVYLSDVARFEWAINEACHAADAATLDPARIGALPQERYAGLVFLAHPSARLLASDYPVDRIWRAHQPDGDLESRIDLDGGGCRLLIDRRDGEIRLLPLDAAGFALVAALVDGRPLQAAYEAATAIDENFDLIGALSAHLTRGTFSDFVDAADKGETQR